MRSDRRAFLKATAGAVAAPATLPLLKAAADAAILSDPRGYVAGHYALELDGVAAGWFRKVSGGSSSAPIPVPSGPQKIETDISPETFTLECGTGMSRAFYDWLKGSFSGGGVRRNGAIVVTNYDHRELMRLNFYNAILNDIAFPACDAASKDAAYLSLKLQPEKLRKVIDPTLKAGGTVNAAVQKQWVPSNFRLTIPGVDCRAISKIDAIKSGGSNIGLTLAASHGADFEQWQKQGGTKSATLDYLESNLQGVLFGLTLSGLSLSKLEIDPSSGPGGGIKHMKVSLNYSNAAVTQFPA